MCFSNLIQHIPTEIKYEILKYLRYYILQPVTVLGSQFSLGKLWLVASRNAF